jgi:urease accessory protein
MAMSIDWLTFVLQTSDPLFPTGAYAHSFGLEEYVRLSGACDEASLYAFLTLQILPALTYQELPYLRFAHTYSAANDLPALITLDHEVNAWKIPSELRSASLRLGSRRLDILLKTAPTSFLSALALRITSGELPGHHLTISGAQYAGIPCEAALITYFYQTLSSYCVAALKLIRIGQEACQRVLASCLQRAPDILRDSMAVERPQAGCFNPLLEIAAMRHATAGERLFIS